MHVLSGFLGSGKTTLLNRLLAALPAGTRAAVVVNDFGAVAVDGALLDRGSYAVAELASGCVCCTLSVPMQEALAALLDDQQPDTILMETTGLAEPTLFAAPEQNFRRKRCPAWRESRRGRRGRWDSGRAPGCRR